MNPMTYDAEVEEFIAGAAAARREALEAQAKWLKAQRAKSTTEETHGTE